jgi:hypothetical protein
MKGDTLITHPIKGRKMYQELNKQGMRKVHMMVTVTTTPN